MIAPEKVACPRDNRIKSEDSGEPKGSPFCFIRIKRNASSGESIKVIADTIGVSKGSVSVWVRDVELTDESRKKLANRWVIPTTYSRTLESYVDQGKANSARYREIRAESQRDGRERFKSNDEMFRMLCLLYWAEGTKRRDAVVFTNSDPDMMRVFITLLRNCFSVSNEAITLRINAHLNNGLSQSDIEAHWLLLLGLPKTQLRKGTYNVYSSASTRQKHNLVYGTAAITVCSTKMVQSIFGGIAGCCDVEFKYLF